MVEANSELLQSFHLMWDNYPFPCSLILKSREVIAVNPACGSIPRTVGSFCAKELPPEKHVGCRAEKALETQEAQTATRRKDDGSASIAFWVPIDGYPDYYLHFAAKIDSE